MTWMNQFDVESAYAFYAERRDQYPVAYKAICDLDALMEWTNANSDGWPYWNAPSKAAKRMQDWLTNWFNRYLGDDETDLTEAEYKAMRTPIKAFLTRQGADWREVLV